MVLFIDVILVNPANGDLVKKTLACPGEVSASYVASAVDAFSKALPEMVEVAKRKALK